MGARDFTDLEVWKLANRLVRELYAGTESYPAEEKYGITLQMRRAAVSITGNIAEGFNRWLPRDRARFYEIAKSSAEELRNYVLLTRDLGYPLLPGGFEDRLASVCRMLYRLRESVLRDLR
jgi:four helix bundle protein